MDNKIEKKLKIWIENNLISEDVFDSIKDFEANQPKLVSKGTLSKTIILIGGLFVFIGLTAIVDQVFPDWAQLISLVVFTSVLFYSAFFIEKKYDGNTFLFDSNEKLACFLFLLATGGFGFSTFLVLEFFDVDEDTSRIITSTLTFILSIYLFNKTKYIYQQLTLIISSEIFLINLLEMLDNTNLNDELMYGVLQILIGSFFLRFTFYSLDPKWLGYLFSCFALVAGVAFIDSYIGGEEFLGIILQLLLAILLIWLSVRLSNETILFVGSFSLLINLPRLITEIFPNLGFLFLLITGTLLIFVGLYLNRLRESIKNI
mgnify:FL=1